MFAIRQKALVTFDSIWRNGILFRASKLEIVQRAIAWRNIQAR